MINFLLPDYIDGIGKCTKLNIDGKESIMYKNISTILRHLFYKSNRDFSSTIENSSKLLGQKNLIPLYINFKEIYIPFKYKIPIVSKDPCYGYVRYEFIENIVHGKIILKDGTVLTSLDNIRCLRKRLKMAELLIKTYSNTNQLIITLNRDTIFDEEIEDKLISDYRIYLLDIFKKSFPH